MFRPRIATAPRTLDAADHLDFGMPVFVGLDAAAAESGDAWEGFCLCL